MKPSFVDSLVIVRGLLLAASLSLFASAAQAADLGIFENATDVGKIDLKGSSEYVPAKSVYRITGSGANIWGTEDAFQFLWKKVSGDLIFSMDVDWVGEGKIGHRKACAMVRQDLSPDSPYVDVAVHGDGLIEMQFRRVKGGITYGARTPILNPSTVKLECDGGVYTVSVAKKGGEFQPVGGMSWETTGPVYAGLAVSSHDAKVSETALISNVVLKERSASPDQKRVRETTLETLTVATGERRIVFRERSNFEAPNWSPDGKLFYINRMSKMCTIPVGGGEPKVLDTGAAIGCNNDHGLSFDGKWLAVSAQGSSKGSKIFIVPAGGGEARLINGTVPSYWHGWAPDGKTIAFCAQRNNNFDVYTMPSEGGEEKRLTTSVGYDDGPEYNPEGTKIYFNTDRVEGVMKIFRMNPDGTEQEQVTKDPEYADWFAHISPDGKQMIFISFDKSVPGHPANKDVVLRTMPVTGGKPKIVATLFGGQGTMNVPSWSPDGTQVAFVSYRYILP
jgi:hypothetical protein